MIRQCTVESLYGLGPVRANIMANKVCLTVLPARHGGGICQQRWLTPFAVRKLSLALAEMADQMEGKT